MSANKGLAPRGAEDGLWLAGVRWGAAEGAGSAAGDGEKALSAGLRHEAFAPENEQDKQELLTRLHVPLQAVEREWAGQGGEGGRPVRPLFLGAAP